MTLDDQQHLLAFFAYILLAFSCRNVEAVQPVHIGKHSPGYWFARSIQCQGLPESRANLNVSIISHLLKDQNVSKPMMTRHRCGSPRQSQ
jgi:hypothetical protein